jgi:predicted nucleotidyltransferase
MYGEQKTIMKCTFGAFLYGTNTPSSDEDFKAIILPSCKDIILQRVKNSSNTTRAKSSGEKNFAGELDMETFSLQKYLQLVYEGQTVSLDMLFVPRNKLIKTSDIWEDILYHRPQLISRKAEAFVSYCMQQAKKYGIKGSRVDAVRKSLDFLKLIILGCESNKKLGAYSAGIFNFVEKQNNEFIKIEVQKIPQTGADQTFLEVCGRKMSFNASIQNAIDTLQCLVKEYGARALMAEKNEGVDWKSLSHAVRIAEQAIELFTTGHIEFPRPNAEYLRDIKLGKYPYKEITESIEDNFIKVQESSVKSILPDSIDKNLIDKLVYNEYLSQCLRQTWEI